MPAVDSPGSPGLSFEQLAELISRLINLGQILGVDVSIYDPDLDPNQRFAQAIVEWLAKAFATVLH
jgi:arginase